MNAEEIANQLKSPSSDRAEYGPYQGVVPAVGVNIGQEN